MLTILHASDLHFGPPHRADRGVALRTMVVESPPDLLVLSGDFTQRAKVGEYELARDYLATLPDLPTVVTPGNHDVPLYRGFERLFAPYRNYRRYISDELDSVHRVGDAVVVALNSAAPHHAVVNGRITPGQVEFASRAFEKADSASVRIVVTHHPMASAPDFETDHLLPRSRELLRAFADMGVELILGGHLHRAYVASSLDVDPLADSSKPVVMVHSGTTTSDRGRARERSGNSLNVIHVRSEAMEIVPHRFSEVVGGFAPHGACTIPRTPPGQGADGSPRSAGTRAESVEGALK